MLAVIENEENNDTGLFGYDYVETRAQEVEAHIGSVQYIGITEPILLSQDLSGGCGGKIWECANILIEYLIWKKKEQDQDLFKDKTIVEIGAGTGLVGLTVAKLCSDIKQLIMTDQIPMMNLMQENIKLNNLNQIVKADILNWGEKIENENSDLLKADIVIASDCIYLEIAFIPLFETFLELTQNPNTIIYLMYRKRRSADKRFFQIAKKKFEFIDMMDDPKREIYTRQGFKLFIVKRKVAAAK